MKKKAVTSHRTPKVACLGTRSSPSPPQLRPASSSRFIEIFLQLFEVFDQLLANFAGLFNLFHQRCDVRRLCQILQLLVGPDVLQLQLLADLMKHLHILCHLLLSQQTNL